MSNRGKHCECGDPKGPKDRCCLKCRAIESDGNRKAGPPVVNGRRRTDYNRNTGMAHKIGRSMLNHRSLELVNLLNFSANNTTYETRTR